MLLIVILILWLNYKFINSLTSKSGPELFFKYFLIIIEVFIAAFAIWFVIEQFHTYKLWEGNLKFNGKKVNL
eukprot:COSAG01_NODE_14_length_41020_cov_40.702133_33_plen_72_part_00